ncbi:hypothetical protein ABT354_11180 [Streptomyces sp. NPDC000594]|uniref:hypothetical protein n=1 Tax=Streptomyces sp. NPDC000594 TaxID=3154261 RepID=UPI0033276266
MIIPAIETWAPRELSDAAKLNRRVTEVHRFLQNPPAARMTGLARSNMAGGSFSVLPFYPVGTEGGGTSYQTWPGMVPVSKADKTMGRDTSWQFVVPVDGRYRITLNGAWNTNAEMPDNRHALWVGIGVDPSAGTGDAVAAAAVDAFSPAQSTPHTLCGGHTTVQQLTAGTKVQFAANCLSASVFGWARDDITVQYKWGSFAEIRWVGTL